MLKVRLLVCVVAQVHTQLHVFAHDDMFNMLTCMDLKKSVTQESSDVPDTDARGGVPFAFRLQLSSAAQVNLPAKRWQELSFVIATDTADLLGEWMASIAKAATAEDLDESDMSLRSTLIITDETDSNTLDMRHVDTQLQSADGTEDAGTQGASKSMYARKLMSAAAVGFAAAGSSASAFRSSLVTDETDSNTLGMRHDDTQLQSADGTEGDAGTQGASKSMYARKLMAWKAREAIDAKQDDDETQPSPARRRRLQFRSRETQGFPAGFHSEPQYTRFSEHGTGVLVESMAFIKRNGKGEWLQVVMRIDEDGLQFFDSCKQKPEDTLDNDSDKESIERSAATVAQPPKLVTAAHLTIAHSKSSHAKGDKAHPHAFSLELSPTANALIEPCWDDTKFVVAVSTPKLFGEWQHAILLQNSPAGQLQRILCAARLLFDDHTAAAEEWLIRKDEINGFLEDVDATVDKADEELAAYGLVAKDAAKMKTLVDQNYEVLNKPADVTIETVTSTLAYITHSFDGSKRQVPLLLVRPGWSPTEIQSNIVVYTPTDWWRGKRKDQGTQLIKALKEGPRVSRHYCRLEAPPADDDRRLHTTPSAIVVEEGDTLDSSQTLPEMSAKDGTLAASRVASFYDVMPGDGNAVLPPSRPALPSDYYEAHVQCDGHKVDGSDVFWRVWLKFSASCETNNELVIFGEPNCQEEVLARIWLAGALVRPCKPRQDFDHVFEIQLTVAASEGWDVLSFCFAFDSEEAMSDVFQLISTRASLEPIDPPELTLGRKTTVFDACILLQNDEQKGFARVWAEIASQDGEPRMLIMSEKDGKVMGYFNLVGCSAGEANILKRRKLSKEHRHVLTLQLNTASTFGHDEYLISTDSKHSMAEWILALQVYPEDSSETEDAAPKLRNQPNHFNPPKGWVPTVVSLDKVTYCEPKWWTKNGDVSPDSDIQSLPTFPTLKATGLLTIDTAFAKALTIMRHIFSVNQGLISLLETYKRVCVQVGRSMAKETQSYAETTLSDCVSQLRSALLKHGGTQLWKCIKLDLRALRKGEVHVSFKFPDTLPTEIQKMITATQNVFEGAPPANS